jgi:hypothetical protein
LIAPADWERKKPANRIVEHEFATPPSEEGETAGRVTVMGAGGGVEQNIQRWKDQFVQSDDSSTDDKTSVEKKDIDGAEVHIVSITGTYKDRPGGGPFTQTEVVLREDYRMLAAIIATESSGHYFIKLYGPREAVDAQEEAFLEMIEKAEIKS